jgi:hypothetical protein
VGGLAAIIAGLGFLATMVRVAGLRSTIVTGGWGAWLFAFFMTPLVWGAVLMLTLGFVPWSIGYLWLVIDALLP